MADSLQSVEELKKQITKLYTDSIQENVQTLNEPVTFLRNCLFEQFPAKVIQLNEQCANIYTMDYLRKNASSVQQLLNSVVPIFATTQQVADHRKLYQQEYYPHVSTEDDTLLLPNGPISVTNDVFDRLLSQLLEQVKQFIWSLNQFRSTLYLLQPPYGEERTFDSKVLSSLVATIEAAYSSAVDKRANLKSVYAKRAEEIVLLAKRPQLVDVRRYLEQCECELFNDIVTYAVMLRNAHAEVHNFALTNRTRIEAILKDALQNGTYVNRKKNR